VVFSFILQTDTYTDIRTEEKQYVLYSAWLACTYTSALSLFRDNLTKLIIFLSLCPEIT